MNVTVNPLAHPKGLSRSCELCRKPAHVMCGKCRVTFYCTHEHQSVDYEGIHNTICDNIKYVHDNSNKYLASAEARQLHDEHIRDKKIEMMQISRTIGTKLLFENRHSEAVPAALQSLKLAIEIFDLSSVELVPSYLILGEASIGIGQLSQAEKYLSQAEWTVTKTSSCPNKIKYKLFRILGLLHAAKSKYEEALSCLADDIYHASLDYGPESIQTSGGYFQMGNVFTCQSKQDVADHLYKKITTIWFQYLKKLTDDRINDPSLTQSDIPRRDDMISLEDTGLDDAQTAEAIRILKSLNEIRTNYLTKNPDELVRVICCQAMLSFILNQIEACSEYCESLARLKNSQEQIFSLERRECIQTADSILHYYKTYITV